MPPSNDFLASVCRLRRCICCSFPTRKASKFVLCLSCFLIPVYFLVIYHLVLAVKWLDLLPSWGKDTSFTRPESSSISGAAEAIGHAYRNDWVGFKELNKTDCQTMVTWPRFKPSRFPARHVQQIPNDDFIVDSFNCPEFQRKYGYQRYMAPSAEELEFPLAFILLFHKDVFQAHVLLRAMYRPHNVYCLTPDREEDTRVHRAALSLASCFPNVFVASSLVAGTTHVGGSSPRGGGGRGGGATYANCMTGLMQHPIPWKYVINTPERTFPLRTNLEMVQILKRFRGANDIEAMVGNSSNGTRHKPSYEFIVKNNQAGHLEFVTLPDPPHNLTIIKGSAYNSLTRPFVKFVLTDTRVKDLLHWARTIWRSDEYLWATINNDPSFHAPGSIAGMNQTRPPHLTLFAIRKPQDCNGQHVRGICILTPGDIPLLMSRREMFANKFHIHLYPQVLHCLDQMIFNKTISGFVGDMSLYDTYFEDSKSHRYY